jgi:histidinol dehydrogenase
MKVNIYKLNSMSQAEVAQLLRRSEIDIESLHETVRPIIKDVKEKGDAAIIE